MTTSTNAAPLGGERSAPRANLVLGMLLLVYIFNFLDRQILGILAEPIKADLKLTDEEFGYLGGTAFAILYSVLGVPLARLADRTKRSWVVGGALAFWSAFTALCGTVTSFWQFFIYRMGVAIGEAGGVAPSHALISEYFPPSKRSRALAIFSLGVPVGLAAGTLLGAYIADAINWRFAFISMGVAGVLLAPIFLLIVKDLPRKPAPVTTEAGDLSEQSIWTVLGKLSKKSSFWYMALAAGFSSLTGYGLALWTPSILIRSYDLDLITTGQFLASLLLIGGGGGMILGGMLADKLGGMDKRWYLWLPAIAWLITAPTFAAAFMLELPLWVMWLILVIPNGLNTLWLGPMLNSIQHLVVPSSRATASGAFLMINNLIGLGIGPPLMGALSDYFKASYGDDSLRLAAVLCLTFYVLAAFLAFLAARTIRGDWVAEEGTTA